MTATGRNIELCPRCNDPFSQHDMFISDRCTRIEDGVYRHRVELTIHNSDKLDSLPDRIVEVYDIPLETLSCCEYIYIDTCIAALRRSTTKPGTLVVLSGSSVPHFVFQSKDVYSDAMYSDKVEKIEQNKKLTKILMEDSE